MEQKQVKESDVQTLAKTTDTCTPTNTTLIKNWNNFGKMTATGSEILYQYKANTCYLIFKLEDNGMNRSAAGCGGVGKGSGSSVGPKLEKIRNCDLYIDDYDLFMYADVKLYRFQSKRCFDLKELKNLIIQFDTKERCYKMQLRCLPPEAAHPPKPKTATKEFMQISQYAFQTNAENVREPNMKMDVSRLKSITDRCQLKIDHAEKLHRFERNFTYGFSGLHSGKLQTDLDYDSDLIRISMIHQKSPIERSIDRQTDELSRFSRDIYGSNFVELQVPRGHENPLKYKFKLNDTVLSAEQLGLLHNLTSKPENKTLPDSFNQTEVDCGLISILLAICYDVRTTGNEPTCESGWTRAVLSPTLCYFEPFDNFKGVVISFMRRVLTYPLYRNYELARICVHDAIEVLNSGRAFLLKQMLVTNYLFETSDPSREILNRFYIDDYIRYVSMVTICTSEHFTMLAHNVKNVLFDITKRHLDLGINEIESDLLKELISEIDLEGNAIDIEDTDDDDIDSNDLDDDEDDDVDADDDDDDDEDDDEDEEDYGEGDDCNAEQTTETTTDSNDSSSVSGGENGVVGEGGADGEGEGVGSGNASASDDADLVFIVDHSGCDDDTSSSSETEGNSVIEQCSSEAGTK